MFGALTAFGAMLVSYVSHRHQVRRAELLDAREGRIEAREQRVEEREKTADRQAVLAQASMIDVRLSVRPSVLHESSSTAQVEITNYSNQPIMDVRVMYGVSALPDVPEWVDPSSTCVIPVPPSRLDGASPSANLRELSTEFTDALGIRWRRDSGGGLREGTQDTDGEWQWGAREAPTISRDYRDYGMPRPALPAAPAAYAEARAKTRAVSPVGCLVLVLLVMGAVGYLVWRLV